MMHGHTYIKLDVHVRKGTYFYIISFQNISFLSIEVSFGKLETVKSVSSAYQRLQG